MIYHHGIIGYLPYTLQTWDRQIQIFKSDEYILTFRRGKFSNALYFYGIVLYCVS